MLVIEYLIIIEKRASSALFGLCDSIEAFEKFLQTEKSISLTRNNQIQHSSNEELINFQAKMGQIKDKDQRFFHIRISIENDNFIIAIITLARAIRKVVIDGGGQIETLWDDVSLYYSHRAYPHIHRIENLMRKLITFFMLTKVGKDWVNTSSPETIRKQIDSKQKQYIDALFQVDFIHLGDFLFKSYTSKNIEELYNLIEEQGSLSDISLDEILEFKASSNWDRYFSNIVDCEANYLNKRWKHLYDLRCDVAHNKLFDRAKYEDVVRLVGEIEPYLEKAFEEANKLEVSSEDIEQIAESVASNINKTYGDFIENWKLLETRLRRAILKSGHNLKNSELSVHKSTQILEKEGSLDNSLSRQIIELAGMRNVIVHEAALELTENEISKAVKQLETLVDEIPITDQPVSFHAECIKRIESYLKIQLSQKSRIAYMSNREDISLTCNISKLHERKPPYYWFGFYRRQSDFLNNSDESYAAFGCGSANIIFLLPTKWLNNYLENCSVTKSPSFYWHIQIIKKDSNFFLYQRDGNHIALSKYLLPN